MMKMSGPIANRAINTTNKGSIICVLTVLVHTLGIPHGVPASPPLVQLNAHADTHADQQDCRQQQEVVAQNSFNMLFHRLHSLDNSLTTHV